VSRSSVLLYEAERIFRLGTECADCVVVELARGIHGTNGEQHPTQDAPYGAKWDLLWIGGCVSGPFENETEFYVISNDPTAAAMKHRWGWGAPLETGTQKFPIDSSR
jgi:hypothetical protein